MKAVLTGTAFFVGWGCDMPPGKRCLFSRAGRYMPPRMRCLYSFSFEMRKRITVFEINVISFRQNKKKNTNPGLSVIGFLYREKKNTSCSDFVFFTLKITKKEYIGVLKQHPKVSQRY